mmetsp:Transcript_28423/g.94372  ORF Transcript_28423/g.94372 Transcript_28423/m.94372 type:complete len:229 (-) Transcript_28423:159-845(-)
MRVSSGDMHPLSFPGGACFRDHCSCSKLVMPTNRLPCSCGDPCPESRGLAGSGCDTLPEPLPTGSEAPSLGPNRGEPGGEGPRTAQGALWLPHPSPDMDRAIIGELAKLPPGVTSLPAAVLRRAAATLPPAVATLPPASRCAGNTGEFCLGEGLPPAAVPRPSRRTGRGAGFGAPRRRGTFSWHSSSLPSAEYWGTDLVVSSTSPPQTQAGIAGIAMHMRLRAWVIKQ